ncbi:hypothetical protein [Sulfurimonas sp.]|uniref:hypothetical protein n=1 Tax=Sulfurimonas sp. TaxID=2022749 RepID=UPI003568E69B
MKSKHFKVHELVPKAMYEKYGEKAWRYVDVRLIESIDKLKEHFNLGTMTINNYYWNGNREWSGIRTPDSPHYSYGSQHSFANALDIVFSDYTAEEVRNYILDNLKDFPHIKGMELGVSWLHIDVRNEDQIVLFTA